MHNGRPSDKADKDQMKRTKGEVGLEYIGYFNHIQAGLENADKEVRNDRSEWRGFADSRR